MGCGCYPTARYLQAPPLYSVNSFSLYAGGKSEKENLLWTVINTLGPLPEVYDAAVLYVRFVSSSLVPTLEVGVKLLYSFHKKFHRPVRLPGGLWNCSVPEWPDFRAHFRCNLNKECEDAQDEAMCFYSGHCGEGYLTLGNRCYIYIRNDDKAFSWIDSNQDCKQRRGYLASLNTPEEWAFVERLLRTRILSKSVSVGLKTVPKAFPFM